MHRASILGAALVISACAGAVQAQPWRESQAPSKFEPIVLLDAPSKQALARNLQVLDTLDIRAAFVDQELKAVLKSLEKSSKVTLDIDLKSLEDASIGLDTLVQCQRQAKLRTVLDDILAKLGLAWIPHREGLRITTKEEAETTKFTVVYPVADLVGADGPDLADYDSLIEVILASAGPLSWRDGGDPTEIQQLPAVDALVISTSWASHGRVQILLAALREARAKRTPPTARCWDIWSGETKATKPREEHLPRPARRGSVF